MPFLRFFVALYLGLSGCTGVVAGAGLDRQAPIALVNKEPVTAGELEDELARLLPVNAAHGKMVDSKQRMDLRRSALEELVVRKLALQYADARAISVPAAEVQAGVARIRRRYRGAMSFKEALRVEGLTPAGLEKRVREELVLKRVYRQEVENRAKVTATEAWAHYEANRARYLLPETLRLHAIFVKDGPEAKKKAEQALAAVVKAKGEFDEAARRYSDDGYRVMGGDYGAVHRGQLPAAAEKAVFGAPAGRLSGPEKVEKGWLVFRAGGRQAARQLTLEEMRGRIKKELSERKLRAARTAFREKLKKGASIKYLAQQSASGR